MAREMKDSGIPWIGEIPAGWSIVKIKAGVYKVGSGKTPSGGATSYADEGVLFLRSQNVYDTGLELSNPTYITPEVDEEMKGTRVFPNDVLLNITGGSIGRCCIFPESLETANVNQHVSIIRVDKRVFLPEFMHYYWISPLGSMAISLYQTGGNREGMSAEAIKNAPIILMPLGEQKRICKVLDVKCAEIDAVLDKTRTSIEEYKKLKQAIITQAVTKGIRGDRSMKESGIVWLDTVPADWTISKIKHTIFSHEKPVLPTDDVITCFRDGMVTLRKNRREEGFAISFTEHGYQGVDVGDLVIHGMDTFAGAIGCSDSRGKTSPVVHVCSTVGNNRYFMYFLRYMAYSNVLMDFSNGVRIRSSDFRNFNKLGVFEILIPPLEEQNEIVDYLDNEILEIEQMINKKEQFLMEVEFYKKSMIYEYITGKKEAI